MTAYDVVVVGGGAAGSVVAARLAEDPDRRVLLLEAGPAPRTIAEMPSRLLDAGRVPGADPSGAFNRWFPATLTPGRPHAVSRGRVLGGSTATNGAYFIRPRRADFDRWSAHGDLAWSWDAVLPLLRGLERDLDLGASVLHGDRGPMPVRRSPLESPAAAAFVEAALAVGHVEERDKNGEQSPGVGAVPMNAADGVRWNAALAYLIAGPRRPNLEVRGGSTVLRILLGAGRVTGVEVLVDGLVTTIPADAVVLSAGALSSPAILLRSGIGPADELRGAGVPALLDAPGIGAAFGDHPQVMLEWHPSAASRCADGGWMGAALNTDEVEVLQSLIPTAELTGSPSAPGTPLPLLVSVSRPEAHGRLTIVDPDPRTPATIAFHYLRSSADRRALREGVRLAAELLAAHPFAAVSTGGAAIDRAVLADDGALDEWVAAHLGTALHTCGTIPFRMADGSPGPVDQSGAVRGVAGLRVADTSILPTVPTRGPAVAAVLTGELVAAAIRVER
ncbi:mycofactocin system GMC family oxidoreductase MftG [uncultured Amnibacterium sp.]|uniref:mycofactocin dehydrogenase MftG n=1 Tax=uncultured Amnibacterium sp. TaxID=1631851 RepID=UPI0035C9C4B6